MYSLVSAIAVPLGLGKRWQEVDVSATAVATLFQDFRRVQLKLLPAPGANPVYLLLEAIAPSWGTFTGTLDELFTALGNASLPTTTQGLAINTRIATYMDVFRGGWKLTLMTRDGNANYALPSADRCDVLLQRTSPPTDYDHVFNHTLVSVNGFYHLTDSNGISGVKVHHANTSRLHSGQNQMGMLSFDKVGALQCVPITDEMITQDVPRKATVRLSQDLTNKTVLLVLGGYLHLPNPVVYARQNLTDYEIDFDGFSWPQRWAESRQYLDLTSLPLSVSPNNPHLVSVQELYSDETIRAYLKLSQSFFVIVDTPHLYSQLRLVRKSGTPNMYLTHQAPQGPLVTEWGRMPEYWYEEDTDDNTWVLRIYNGFRENKIFETSLKEWLTIIDHGNEASPAGRISSAYLLEIGRDI